MSKTVVVSLDELRQMIREEVTRLQGNIAIGDEEMTVREFADFMHWSVGYARQRLFEVPHEKIGGQNIILRKNAEAYKNSLR